MAEIVSISIPKNSIGKIEELQKKLGVFGRSELIRMALEALNQNVIDQANIKGEVNALLLITHEHKSAVSSLFHNWEKLIKTHIHSHVDEKCVEIILLKGDIKKINEFSTAMLRNKSVVKTKIVLL